MSEEKRSHVEKPEEKNFFKVYLRLNSVAYKPSQPILSLTVQNLEAKAHHLEHDAEIVAERKYYITSGIPSTSYMI